MFSLLLIEVGNPLDCKVVRLGRPRCPDDLFWVGPNQLGHLTTGRLYRLLGLPPIGMGLGSGVSKLGVRSEILHHHLCNPGVNRRCRRVVQIDGTVG